MGFRTQGAGRKGKLSLDWKVETTCHMNIVFHALYDNPTLGQRSEFPIILFHRYHNCSKKISEWKATSMFFPTDKTQQLQGKKERKQFSPFFHFPATANFIFTSFLISWGNLFPCEMYRDRNVKTRMARAIGALDAQHLQKLSSECFRLGTQKWRHQNVENTF